jgi:hypothetical protein
MDEQTPPQPEWRSHFDAADAFAALRTDRCRATLRALDASGGQLSLVALADAILARNGSPPAEPTGDGTPVRRRALIDLHHVTLPKLASCDVVTYDPARTVATLTPAGESLLPLVEHVDHVETRR